jgi:glycine/D-amino acid oxidase-like deaminating enzyme
MTSNQYLVVGSGTFGLSAAYALRQRGHRVTVFDRLDSVPAKDAASNDINKIVRPDYANDALYMVRYSIFSISLSLSLSLSLISSFLSASLS